MNAAGESDVAELDPVARSRYLRRFEGEVENARWRSAPDALAHVAEAGIVLVGEYHPLPSACRTAAELLRRWHGAGIACGLGVEMVHARDQHILDAYLGGAIGALDFRRRIRYREEWGYPWPAVHALFRTVRATCRGARALDLPPRGGVGDLRRRDRAAAERIALWADSAAAGSRMVVVFGEAHVAAPHLPAEIERRLSRRARIARVVHDLETAGLPAASGWHAARNGLFARQTEDTGARGKALAQTWRRWERDVPAVGEIDGGHVLHELIEAEAEAVGVDPRRVRTGPARWLADDVPEVFGPGDDLLARRVLRAAGHGARDAARLCARAKDEGAIFDPRANAVLIGGPALGPIALAAARWLVGALCGTAGEPAREAGALALAMLVDPSIVSTTDRVTAGRARSFAAAIRPGSVGAAAFRRLLTRMA